MVIRKVFFFFEIAALITGFRLLSCFLLILKTWDLNVEVITILFPAQWIWTN